VGKLEGMRPLERPRHGWVYNIKMDLGEIGWGDMDWREGSYERGVKLRVPKNVGTSLNSCITGSLSRRAELHGIIFKFVSLLFFHFCIHLSHITP
jgi:hypothetical protein